MPESLLRIPQVQARTGLSRASIYALLKRDDFPKPVKIGKITAWPSSAIDAWVSLKIGRGAG